MEKKLSLFVQCVKNTSAKLVIMKETSHGKKHQNIGDNEVMTQGE